MERPSNSADQEISDLGPSIRIEANGNVWRKLKQILEYQIAIGNYPIGSTLPAVRSLAFTLGINKNTVSRAYTEMQAEGLVKSLKGKGVMVVNKPRSSNLNKVADELFQQLKPLIQQALWQGLPREQIGFAFNRAMNSLTGQHLPRVAYVECNLFDANSIAKELSANLSIPIEAVILPNSTEEEVPDLRGYNLVITPLFHLNEVTSLMQDCPGEVEGISLSPDVEDLLIIARLDSQAIVGLVALGDRRRSIASLTSLLHSYSNAKILSCSIHDEDDLKEILAKADVIVDTLACHEELVQRAGSQRINTLKFHVDRQSEDYLHHKLQHYFEAANY